MEQDLLRRIEELERWRAERTMQQITLPLDETSRKIIQEDLLVFRDLLIFTRANGVVMPYSAIVTVNNKAISFPTQTTPHVYTVDVGTNVFTSTAHGFIDTDEVVVFSTGTTPGGLLNGLSYFIRDATANTFKLAATSGGVAIDITSTGTGTQFISYLF